MILTRTWKEGGDVEFGDIGWGWISTWSYMFQ